MKSSVQHHAISYTSRDGFPLSGHCWMPKAPRAIIALIHGLNEHCGRYDRFARVAAARGFGVVAVDLRGHGESFGDRAYVERFSEYLLDADALMGKARKLAGPLPLFLMGHSMGGAVAMRWVAERQPDLAGLVLSSAALKIGAEVSKLLILLAPVISKFAPRLGVKKLDANLISRDEDEVEAYRNDPLINQGPTPARTGAELLWAIEANRAAAPIQTLPLYLFHGDADSLTDPEGSRELYATWGCQDKTLRIWPGSRHESLNDLDRDAVMEELFDWVDIKVSDKAFASQRDEDERMAVIQAAGAKAPQAPGQAALPKAAVPARVPSARKPVAVKPAPASGVKPLAARVRSKKAVPKAASIAAAPSNLLQ